MEHLGPDPNQSMKPTSRLRYNFSVFATTPSTSSRCPAILVRLKLVRCPHSLAPTSLLYLLCHLAQRSIHGAHTLPPYCCSTLAVAYDVFSPRKHPSGFPS